MRASILRFDYPTLCLGRRLTDQETEKQADATLFLLGQLAERLADYESDVLALLGPDYRSRCLALWKFRCAALDPAEVPCAWRRIVNAVCGLRRSQADGHRTGARA